MPVDPMVDATVSQAGEDTARSDPRRGRLRRRLLVVGAVGLPALVFVLWWFQPQALLFDNVVDEAFPAVTDAGEAGAGSSSSATEESGSGGEVAGSDAAADGPVDGDAEPGEADAEPDEAVEVAPPTGPVALAAGSFVSRNRYTVTGSATTYQLEDGERILRLADFESTNGPDLFVYLTVAGSADDDTALDAEFIDLGTLTGNVGDQNYVIPADVDLDRYVSVVIWCRRFATSFGVADLAAA